MAGNINAIGILITILLTVLLILKFGKKPNKRIRFYWGILWACLVAVLAAATSTHLCTAGQPVFQWLIPCISLGCILTLIEPKKIRRVASAIIIISTFLLSQQYISLVHTNTYTGNPQGVKKFKDIKLQHSLQAIKEILSEEAKTNNLIYPQGWLSKSEIKELIPESERRCLEDDSLETYCFWHTVFTQLYGKNHKKIEMWYPGGLLKESVDRLEFREK